jgi:hypothetical protein
VTTALDRLRLVADLSMVHAQQECSIGCQSTSRHSRVEAKKSHMLCEHVALSTNFWWRFTDSNRGPVDYDSIALTD